MKKNQGNLKSPVVLEAKNSEVYVGGYGYVCINDVSIDKLFKKWLGEGTSTVNLSITITPVDPMSTNLSIGGQDAISVNLEEYVSEEEEQDEQSGEEIETPENEE